MPSVDCRPTAGYAIGSWAGRRPELPMLWQMWMRYTPGGREADGREDDMSMETSWALLLTFHENRPGLSPLAPPV